VEHGLYVNSLIYGYNFEENDENILLSYRKMLEDSIKSGKETLETLYEKAKKIDEKAIKNISKNDKKRIFRILEIYYISNISKTDIDIIRKDECIKKEQNIEEENNNHENLSYKIFYIDMEREKLYERINKRADIMLDEGIIEETKRVIKKIADRQNKSIYDILENYNEITSLQAIGYREVIAYLKGEYTKKEMVVKIKQNTRRYAKRQITWFKKNQKIVLDRNLDDNTLLKIIEENI
jgi:tRNA dimethylallyltransferase